MGSGNFDLTTYYAKRIIGDAAAATAANALLQTGDDITSNTWILHRTNRTTKKYGIHYAYDGTNGHDKIEFYGKGTNDNATAWIQLDTGDASFNSILGKVEITNIDIPNTVTSYYFPYVSSSSSGVQALLTSGRIYLYDGTNRTHICIGNNTRQGGITLWGSGGNYTDIITEAATSNKTVHIPNYSGWVAVGGDGSSTGVGNSYRPVYLSASGQLTTTTSYFVNGSTNSHQLGGFSVVAASTTHTNVADYAGHRLTLMTTDDGLLLWDNDQSAEIWSWRKNSSGIWQGSITGNAVTATRANITTTQYGIAYYSNTTGTFASTTYGTAGQVLIGKGSNAAPDWYGGLTLSGTGATAEPYEALFEGKVTAKGSIYSGTTSTASEKDIVASTNSGKIFMYSIGNEDGNGARGLYVNKVGDDGLAFSLIAVDTNSNTTYRLYNSTLKTTVSLYMSSTVPDGVTAADRTWYIPVASGNRYFVGSNSSSYTYGSIMYANSTSSVTSAARVKYIPYTDAELGETTGKVAGLFIVNTTYGNTAANLGSNTVNVFRYGDPGPQIRFSSAYGTDFAGANKSGAIIYSDNSNSIGIDSAFHFVSRLADSAEGDTGVVSNTFIAKNRITIGRNYANTSYTLFVDGTTYTTDNITISHDGGARVNIRDGTNTVFWIGQSSNHDYQGIYSYGYEDSDGVFHNEDSDKKYLIYRNNSGQIIVNGRSTEARYLENRGGNTVTITDTIWSHGHTPNGHTSRATVWHQAWTQDGLTYTPTDGTATNLTDYASMVWWLSSSNTENKLQVNVALDGNIFTLGQLKGAGGRFGYDNYSYAFSASSAIINSWIRTKGATGWYNEDHGGGLCMRDDTYVRMYGNKQFLITSGITPSATNLSSQLIVSSLGHGTAADSLGSTSGGTVAIELWRGSNASWQISNNAGTLYFKNNWTTALQSTYSQTAMSIAYNTGNTTISGELTVNNLIKSTYNGNTVTIGSQNNGYCHIYNSANIPFIFNKAIHAIGKADLGNTSYPWGNLYIGGANNGIYFVGTKNNYRMIRFLDNTGDVYGNGISIGGGGVTILGSGESSDTLITNLSLTGGTETTYITSDNSIEFYPSQNGYDASARIWMTASVLNIGVDGNTTRESSVNVYSGAGRIQLYSAAATTGNRGIWVAAHGTGAAKTVITVDTNNNVTLNGNAATATRINGNLTAATSDVNRNIWVSSGAGADGIPNYISGFNMNPSTKVFTVPAGTRISPSAGALYLGNSGNQGWVYVQDICSQDEQKWKIHQSGAAEFTGTVTAPTFSGNASSATSLSGGLVTNTVTSHGNLAVTTAKGSYYGINFGHNASGMSIMSINASHQGLYNQTNGQWIIYYNAASTSKSISIGSSTVNITGGISLNLNTKITGTLEMTGNQTITGAGAHWTKWQNTTTGVIISMWSDTTNQGIYSYSYWNGSANASGAGWILYRGTDSYVHTSFRLYGAVWNDYAEYRECDKLTPGTCVQEHNNGHLTQSDRRLIPGASIISDTFGFAEGQTEKADTPIAVSGRVLACTYRDRYEYHAGQAVCSAPNGTVDIMSRDEIMMYPDAIVGIVSEIPEYEEWGTDHIKVNNRIWIKVK